MKQMANHLYIHIPFCLKKCIYCDFLSVPFEESLARKYTDALCRELTLKAQAGGKMRSIYLGGGTPTVLPVDDLEKILMTVKDRFGWEKDAEITVEANPNSVSREGLSFLRSSGVNRISLGVQSFHDRELAVLGRLHNAEDARRSLASAMEAGFLNISIDLMYRIPSQTSESWSASLSEAISISPQHISAYELTPEKDTPLWPLLSNGSLHRPGEEETLLMHEHMVRYLREIGYAQYEISNFSVPGRECIHNINYWKRGEYIGTGAGAHSFIAGTRFANEDNIMTYITSLEKEIIPEKSRELLSPDESIEEFMFLGLRMTDGVEAAEAEQLVPGILLHCEPLLREGFLEVSSGRLKLTARGMTVSNSVFAEIFRNISQDAK